IITVFAFCFVLLFAQGVYPQEKLTLNQAVDIEPDKTQTYPISLNDRDYVSGSITQRGKVDVIILNPDGSLMRRFLGPSGDAKNSFAFVAEGGGVYSINIGNPGEQAVNYELLLEKILSLNERLQPEPWSDPYPSPRIQALRSQIASGQTKTEAFWKEVAQQGTPLVESFGSDGKHQLVTFLWRSQHETRNVVVRGSFEGPGSATDFASHRIGNSDVWYLTMKFPRGARFTYKLSPNDPLTFIGPRARQRGATLQTDPLNPRRSDCPAGASKFRCQSVAELPGAVPQSWSISKPGTAEGRIEKHTIKSEIQKIERGFSVYTPPNYKSEARPNALLVLFDEEEYLSSDQQAQTMLNNLIAASKIPPTVVVLVRNVGNRRLVDLIANSEFADFLATELIPWVRTHYNVTKVEPMSTIPDATSHLGCAPSPLQHRAHTI
ncbi:MAG: enterochelin esterase domain-containing protein, partial [Pyrinomonadaceae bacterium]